MDGRNEKEKAYDPVDIFKWYQTVRKSKDCGWNNYKNEKSI